MMALFEAVASKSRGSAISTVAACQTVVAETELIHNLNSILNKQVPKGRAPMLVMRFLEGPTRYCAANNIGKLDSGQHRIGRESAI
jgi:hypothetical protein